MATVDSGGDWSVLHSRFDDYGNIAATFGDTADANLTAAPQVWSGMFLDETTGLFDAAGRGWYDPQIGRYLTDAGGINGYRAFGNQPSNVASTSINWEDHEGPGALNTVGSIGFGLIDSTPFGLLYGDDVRSQTNGGYWVGLAGGIIGQVLLGNLSAGVLGASNASRGAMVAARAYQAYAAADAAVGVGYSGYSVYRTAAYGDAFNPLSLVGFVPAVGFASEVGWAVPTKVRVAEHLSHGDRIKQVGTAHPTQMF